MSELDDSYRDALNWLEEDCPPPPSEICGAVSRVIACVSVGLIAVFVRSERYRESSCA